MSSTQSGENINTLEETDLKERREATFMEGQGEVFCLKFRQMQVNFGLP